MSVNYKFLIQYDGTRFYGWEHQPSQEMTIQGKLEAVLSTMAGEAVEVIGAGRTDAGVHAKGMVANAKLKALMDVDELRDYMNQYLPEDICIKEVRIAAEGFHSRYKAQGKTYQYTCYIGETKPVFDRKYVHVLEDVPNVAAMRKAAAYLMGTHDFASFCGNPKMKKSTVRMVDRIDIDLDGDYLRLTYHGSGFLQYMVRILTGTLLEVGFGQRDPESIPELIEAKNRSLAGPTAPAKGLCLLKVDY
ncbi:MAG: tRNA pseudouridine(38-40) synthase TruA [Lachnospiraceae bacterium]|nr:tRNA pseudouridine(38-40) synthase TruA [Lachnospiraceae bacterium]